MIDAPTFKLADLDLVGNLKVSFSQAMRIVEDTDRIDNSVIEFELDINESNYSDDPDDFDFTWKVVQFEERSMNI